MTGTSYAPGWGPAIAFSLVIKTGVSSIANDHQAKHWRKKSRRSLPQHLTNRTNTNKQIQTMATASLSIQDVMGILQEIQAQVDLERAKRIKLEAQVEKARRRKDEYEDSTTASLLRRRPSFCSSTCGAS